MSNNSRSDRHIKAILFDLDGTLLDTAPDLIRALDKVLEQYGFPSSDPVLARAEVSHGATALLKNGFGEEYARFDALTLRQELLDVYYQDLVIDTDLFASFDDVLETYQTENIAWGIVTNKPAFLTYPLMEKMLHKRPILNHSQCLIAADSFATRKPFASGLLHGAAELKAAPKHIAYIGDSVRDIEAGQHANMFTVAASFGYIGKDVNIHTWNADKIIASPKELLELT